MQMQNAVSPVLFKGGYRKKPCKVKYTRRYFMDTVNKSYKSSEVTSGKKWYTH